MSSVCITSIAEAWLQPNFCARTYATGLWEPRGLHIAIDDIDHDEILLVERKMSRVVRLDNDGSSVVPVEVAAIDGLSHGIELSGGHLYASSPTTVYRVPYLTGQTTPSSMDEIEEVVVGMDRYASGELGAPDGHSTRTLAFDPAGKWLYVSIGSEGNVDSDSHRARIRRFDIASWDNSSLFMTVLSRTPLEFNEGEVFADGLRNEVGLAFDSFGVLWGVENGADNLYRGDLGGYIIHNENPAEELNRFSEGYAGKHWGYPYCWSEYCLSPSVGGSGTKGAGTVWAWPDFMNIMNADGAVITDEWCRTSTVPSVVAMPSHSAPLGLTFYNWRDMSQESECVGGFPRSFDKYAFIAFHGSWNRNPPTGYKVVFIPFDGEGNPMGQPIDLFRHDGDSAEWSSGSRPVDVQFDRCGRLYVTDDGVGSVIMITFSGGYADDFVPINSGVADGPSCSVASPPSGNPTAPSTRLPATPIPTPTSQDLNALSSSPTPMSQEPNALSSSLTPLNPEPDELSSSPTPMNPEPNALSSSGGSIALHVSPLHFFSSILLFCSLFS